MTTLFRFQKAAATQRGISNCFAKPAIEPKVIQSNEMLKKQRYNTFDFQKCKTRWICYFDILGFKKQVARQNADSGSLANAVLVYYQSREIFEDYIRRKPKLKLVCWSDSFIIYSDDESAMSFWHIEQVARLILNEHTSRHIPIRGAISCGTIYLDEEDGIYIGKALIEAYEDAENQNWICLLLCRSATQQLGKLKLPPSRRLNYRRWKIPWNKKKRGQKALYAYLIGASHPTSGKNDYLGKLQQMMFETETRRDKNKYQKSIKFLEHHGVSKLVGEQ